MRMLGTIWRLDMVLDHHKLFARFMYSMQWNSEDLAVKVCHSHYLFLLIGHSVLRYRKLTVDYRHIYFYVNYKLRFQTKHHINSEMEGRGKNREVNRAAHLQPPTENLFQDFFFLQDEVGRVTMLLSKANYYMSSLNY
jgi:hypothetical protein